MAFIPHSGGMETKEVRQAQTAGQAWGPVLADPTNHAPRCPASASGVCCCCLFSVTQANKVFFLLFKPPIRLSCICLMQPEMCHRCNHHVPHPAIQNSPEPHSARLCPIGVHGAQAGMVGLRQGRSASSTPLPLRPSCSSWHTEEVCKSRKMGEERYRRRP